MAKKTILFIIFLSLIGTLRLMSTNNAAYNYNFNNFPFIENHLISSSRYTTFFEKDPVKYQEYLDNYYLNYSDDDIYMMNYVKISENSDLILYFHPTSFSIIVHNKLTNYQWSSRAEFISNDQDNPEANRRKLNEMQSGLWVEYVIATNVTQRTLLSNVLQERATVTYTKLTDKLGFRANVDFVSLGFSFVIEVFIEENQLVVFVDYEKIRETVPRYRLIGLQIFPYLGAARQDKYPGYLFIPDGVGALVRFNEQLNTFYQARYYGDDYGYSKSPVNRHALTMPVFGIVHDVDKNGFLGIIESGDTMASLGAYFWGYESVNYFRTSPRYFYREVFTNVIDKTGGGSQAVQETIKPININVRYIFLSDDEANYVGMANNYKEYLEEKDILNKQTVNGNIPLGLDYIMTELEPSFIGSRRVKMTTPKDVLNIYDNFTSEGIDNQVLNIFGWSVSGIYDTAPYKVRYSDSRSDYKHLINLIEDDGNKIYFNTNYTTATSSSSRIKYGTDVARQMSKIKMDIRMTTGFEKTQSTYFLYPMSSLNYALSDVNDFNRLGINNLSFDHLGNTLFSYYHKGIRYHRGDSLEYYHQIMENYQGSGFYQPNAYMFKYTNDYFNLPLYNSQHNYFTDLVPFLPIVLKGNIDYFSNYLNFNSLGKDQILNLIDFGINPSFILTNEMTTKMRYTKASHFYSTYYNDYKDIILETYNYINQALSEVYGESITSRTVLAPGVVRVDYTNNKSVYINYTSKEITFEGITILAKDYVVK